MPAGSGPASASRISPRVTRSQWQTISPYAGSRAIAAAERYGRSALLAEVRHAHRPVVVARHELQARVAEPFEHVLGDRHRGGEPGRADAADAHVALAGMKADLVVAVLGRGPEADVDRRHLLGDERRHEPPPLRDETREAGRRGRRRPFVVDVLGGRPEHHVAEDGRAHEHALGTRRRHRQEHVAHQRPRELVVHDELAAPRGHREVVVAEEAVDRVRREPGGVHDVIGVDVAARRREHVGRVGAGAAPLHRGPEPQRHAVQHRLGRERERGRERTNDGLVRDRERAERPRPEMGLEALELREPDLPRRPVAGRARSWRRSRGGGRAAPRPMRSGARRCARSECRPPARTPRATRSRAARDATRASPAWCRSRCAGWRYWPCSYPRRRRRRPRAGRRRADGPRARARSRHPRRRRR